MSRADMKGLSAKNGRGPASSLSLPALQIKACQLSSLHIKIRSTFSQMNSARGAKSIILSADNVPTDTFDFNEIVTLSKAENVQIFLSDIGPGADQVLLDAISSWPKIFADSCSDVTIEATLIPDVEEAYAVRQSINVDVIVKDGSRNILFASEPLSNARKSIRSYLTDGRKRLSMRSVIQFLRPFIEIFTIVQYL